MIKRDLRPFAPIGLMIGLGGALGALAVWALQQEVNLYVQTGLVIAVLGITVWALLDPGQIERWARGRQARYGSNAVVMSLAFVGILGVIAYLAQSNSKRWDLTEDQTYTLADQSKEVVAGLPQPVEAVAYYSSNLGSAKDSFQPLLEEYKHAGDGKFDYRFVDPVSNPSQAQQAGVTRDGTVVFTMGDKSEQATFPQEEDITSALIKLSNAEQPVVYFLSGHGERDIADTSEQGLSNVKDALERQNYVVKPLSLLTGSGVPEDADAVVVNAPIAPLAQTEVDLLAQYLDAGGSLVWLQEPTLFQDHAAAADPLAGYLSNAWGLSFRDDVVIDLGGSQAFNDPFATVVVPAQGYGAYGSSPITSKLQGLATVYPSARSIAVGDQAPAGVAVSKLVETGEQAWGETDFAAVEDFLKAGGTPDIQFDEGSDAAGPLTLVASAQNSSTQARVLVVGDVEFATNQYFAFNGNGDLYLNGVNWAAEQENLISLTPKAQTNRVIVPPSAQTARLIFLGTVVLIPLAVLAMGAAAWWQRRRHA